MKIDYEQRLARVVSRLEQAGMDALLLCSGPDLYYLTGFEHSHAGERLLALVLRRDGRASWIAPAMNATQVEASALAGQAIRTWTDAETFQPALRAATDGLTRVAFDDRARSAFLLDLLTISPGIRVSKASSIIAPLRIRKTSDELDRLRNAGRTVDETIAEAVAMCRPGVTESSVDEALQAALLRRAPESRIGFTIVASGPNSALPHHETGRRPFQRGDVVVLDYGTWLEGYFSDITVTCVIGSPIDPEVKKVYRVVWEAQQKALEAIRPGVTCDSVDRAARQHIQAEGYGEQFLHRTGHGLGLELHEAPYIVSGNDQRLEEGMVFSVEPGIYLPGRFGVRLEVITTVGPDGPDLINQPSSQQLLRREG